MRPVWKYEAITWDRYELRPIRMLVSVYMKPFWKIISDRSDSFCLCLHGSAVLSSYRSHVIMYILLTFLFFLYFHLFIDNTTALHVAAHVDNTTALTLLLRNKVNFKLFSQSGQFNLIELFTSFHFNLVQFWASLPSISLLRNLRKFAKDFRQSYMSVP